MPKINPSKINIKNIPFLCGDNVKFVRNDDNNSCFFRNGEIITLISYTDYGTGGYPWLATSRERESVVDSVKEEEICHV